MYSCYITLQLPAASLVLTIPDVVTVLRSDRAVVHVVAGTTLGSGWQQLWHPANPLVDTPN